MNWSDIDSILNVLSFMQNIIKRLISIPYFIIFMIFCRKKVLYKKSKSIDDPSIKKALKYYVDTGGKLEEPYGKDNSFSESTLKLIPHFIKKEFKNSDTRYYIILADSGMGKTTFLSKLYLKYGLKFATKHNIEFISLSQDNSNKFIEDIKNKENTILLLDAFDEDKYAINNFSSRLDEIYKLTNSFYKVIITCRTQFYPDKFIRPNIIGPKQSGTGDKNERIKYFSILSFNDNQINQYLKKKYRFNSSKKIQARQIINKCDDLWMRPMILSYMDDLLSDKTKIYKYIYQIYDQIVDRWLHDEYHGGSNEKDFKAELMRFSKIVAYHMFISNTLFIYPEEIDEICLQGEILFDPQTLKTKSLLSKNVYGIFKFAHKSIMEYILSTMAFTQLDLRKQLIENNFNSYDMAERFIKDMYLNDMQEKIDKSNSEFASCTILYYPLNNIIFPVKHITNCVFEGCNLSKTVFESTVFKNVIFRDTNLQDADLQNAIFENITLQNVHLKNVNFKNANLQGVDFCNTDLTNVNLENADITGAIFGEDQIKIIERIYSMTEKRNIVFSTIKIYVQEIDELLDYKKYIKYDILRSKNM